MGFNDDLGLVATTDGGVALDADGRHEVAPGIIHFAVLTTLCEAIDNHANTDDEKAALMRVLEHHPRSPEWEKQKKRSRRLREPLCEADDEYWYL